MKYIIFIVILSKMLKKSLTKHLLLLKKQQFALSYTYHNLPTIHEYYYNDNKITLDDQIDNYNTYTQAFLQKRRLLKYEIPPKIATLKKEQQYIKQFMNQSERHNPLVELPLNTLKVMFENVKIDSNYIKNIFLEKDEENLYQSVLEKVWING